MKLKVSKVSFSHDRDFVQSFQTRALNILVLVSFDCSTSTLSRLLFNMRCTETKRISFGKTACFVFYPICGVFATFPFPSTKIRTRSIL
mmetsp:Transcript_17474/g.48251  ORF Transcript_17474/g.48251 Transcript_17474/m.48251 type:complete len:89 (-) Transcript_17474:260-526(-)